MESIIDFYQQNEISPEHQDIEDLNKHFDRRASLYRSLGILPLLVKGKKVLEIGPGSGFNSIYTAALEPERFVMVEPNPTGVKDIKELFSQFSHLSQLIEIEQVLLEDYHPEYKFDLVFCEGLLTGAPKPVQLLKQMANLVAPGGILIITCVDAISYLPETLRRLLAQRVLSFQKETLSLQGKVDLLLPIFTPHLQTLEGMSKHYDHWLIDNLILPAAMGEELSIFKAIEALNPNFEVYGSSPKFLTDWRWYKDLYYENKQFNHLALKQYWEQVHNFLDYRTTFAPQPFENNQKLMHYCSQLRQLIPAYEKDYNQLTLNSICHELEQIIEQVDSFSKPLALAFQEASEFLTCDSIEIERIKNCKHFKTLFGRSQQYISFTRNSSGFSQ